LFTTILAIMVTWVYRNDASMQVGKACQLVRDADLYIPTRNSSAQTSFLAHGHVLWCLRQNLSLWGVLETLAFRFRRAH
jgi:hypothetical protein